MAGIEDRVNQRLKCRAYKNAENPDGRETMCGEPCQTDEDGREFFEIPGHQREYIRKLMPSYEVSEVYEVGDKPAKAGAKRGPKPKALTDFTDEE